MAGPFLGLPLKLATDIARPLLTDKPITADGAFKLTEASWKALSIFLTSKILSIVGSYPGLDAFLGFALPAMTSDRAMRPASEYLSEKFTGLDYVSPDVKAEAKAGVPEAVNEVNDATVTNDAAAQDALMNEPIPEPEP